MCVTDVEPTAERMVPNDCLRLAAENVRTAEVWIDISSNHQVDIDAFTSEIHPFRQRGSASVVCPGQVVIPGLIRFFET